MTIQEAIKSGKPFRLPSWRKDVYVSVQYDLIMLQNGQPFSLYVDHLISTDWEIVECSVPV